MRKNNNRKILNYMDPKSIEVLIKHKHKDQQTSDVISAIVLTYPI